MQNILSDLNRNEVLRYLGYKGSEISPRLNKTIDSCMEETLSIITPKYIFKRFDIVHNESDISIASTGVKLQGKAIKKHLYGCRQIYIMCVTVGLGIEKLIRQKMLYAPDQAVILDSCGSVAVEQLADFSQEQIENECKGEGLYLTYRFSPGYADLPIDTQRDLINIMDSYKKIGLTLNESMIMTPGKSVTAIIGLTEKKPCVVSDKCDLCSNKNTCNFRRRNA